jgi:hypothetical protein
MMTSLCLVLLANAKKAKWGLFMSEVESLFASLPPPTSASAGKKIFRKIFLTASKHSIPAGYKKDFCAGMLSEAVDLANERDRRREINPQNPVIQHLNTQISDIISCEAKTSWINHVDASHPQANPEKHWKLLRSISGKRRHQPPNRP